MTKLKDVRSNLSITREKFVKVLHQYHTDDWSQSDVHIKAAEVLSLEIATLVVEEEALIAKLGRVIGSTLVQLSEDIKG